MNTVNVREPGKKPQTNEEISICTSILVVEAPFKSGSYDRDLTPDAYT